MSAPVATGYDRARVAEAIHDTLSAAPDEVPCPRPEVVAARTDVLEKFIATLLIFAGARRDALPEDTLERRRCQKAVEDAERVRRLGPGFGLQSAVAHTKALARAADDLMTHAEAYRSGHIEEHQVLLKGTA